MIKKRRARLFHVTNGFNIKDRTTVHQSTSEVIRNLKNTHAQNTSPGSDRASTTPQGERRKRSPTSRASGPRRSAEQLLLIQIRFRGETNKYLGTLQFYFSGNLRGTCQFGATFALAGINKMSLLTSELLLLHLGESAGRVEKARLPVTRPRTQSSSSHNHPLSYADPSVHAEETREARPGPAPEMAPPAPSAALRPPAVLPSGPTQQAAGAEAARAPWFLFVPGPCRRPQVPSSSSGRPT